MPTEFDTTFVADDLVLTEHVKQFALPLQAVESGAAFYRPDLNSTPNEYRVEFDDPQSNGISAYETGLQICFKAGSTNDENGPSTLEVIGPSGSVGAKPITKRGGEALDPGDIQEDQLVLVAYNNEGGGRFEVLSSIGSFSGAPMNPAHLPTGIDAAKIGSGTVSNTEFGYLDGVTSSIQNQIDNINAEQIAGGSVSNTEFVQLTGVTGNIQEQLDEISLLGSGYLGIRQKYEIPLGTEASEYDAVAALNEGSSVPLVACIGGVSGGSRVYFLQRVESRWRKVTNAGIGVIDELGAAEVAMHGPGSSISPNFVELVPKESAGGGTDGVFVISASGATNTIRVVDCADLSYHDYNLGSSNNYITYLKYDRGEDCLWVVSASGTRVAKIDPTTWTEISAATSLSGVSGLEVEGNGLSTSRIWLAKSSTANISYLDPSTLAVTTVSPAVSVEGCAGMVYVEDINCLFTAAYSSSACSLIDCSSLERVAKSTLVDTGYVKKCCWNSDLRMFVTGSSSRLVGLDPFIGDVSRWPAAEQHYIGHSRYRSGNDSACPITVLYSAMFREILCLHYYSTGLFVFAA